MKRETMTSRERVIRAINREPVDRIPIDLGSHMSTGISMFAYWNLRKHLGLSTDRIWVPDMVQCLAYVDVDILKRFHCDCILLEPPFPRTARWNPWGEYTFSIAAQAQPQQTADGEWIIRKGNDSIIASLTP
jgi:uroporphyrinogen decarboxylase